MDGAVFAFDPDWVSTLNAPFMTNAFLAGLCIALAAGVMGYFTIARHSTFAAHALAHIGLPGATCLFPQVLACSLSAEHW